MKIDMFTSAGTKKGTIDLPAHMFEAPVNKGLMHRMIVLQQSNRRTATAHVKTRGEVQGSTRKLYAQKGTGRARAGSANSPTRRGGGKAFGPRNNRNFIKNMPRKQRRAALFSCLSHQAKEGKIIALESYTGEAKTKEFISLFKLLPVVHGRKVLVVLPEEQENLVLSARNVPGIKLLLAQYLNPEDVLTAHSIIFLKDAVKVAEEVFGGNRREEDIEEEKKEKKVKRASSQKVQPSTTSDTSESSTS